MVFSGAEASFFSAWAADGSGLLILGADISSRSSLELSDEADRISEPQSRNDTYNRVVCNFLAELETFHSEMVHFVDRHLPASR